MAAVPHLEVDLNDEERLVLSTGLAEWGGSAHPTEELARLMGFRDVVDLHERSPRLLQRLTERQPLTGQDLQQLLAATELAFVSDRWGSGLDWEMVSPLGDQQTITVLRSLQRKLSRTQHHT